MSDLIDWTAYAATAAWVIFALWYQIRARWWKQPEGRNIMGVALGIVAILILVSIARLWPDWAGRPVLQLLVYASLVGLAVQRTVQLERAQRRHRHDEHVDA